MIMRMESRSISAVWRVLRVVASGALLLTVSACPWGGMAGYRVIQSITVSSGSVLVGADVQLSATAKADDPWTWDVTETAEWTTSSAGIATVVGGLVTGISPGTVTITAEEENITGSESVTVSVSFDNAGPPGP